MRFGGLTKIRALVENLLECDFFFILPSKFKMWAYLKGLLELLLGMIRNDIEYLN